MASMFDKLAKFARSPQGKRMIDSAADKAQRIAKDPATRAKLERVRGEVTKRRRPH